MSIPITDVISGAPAGAPPEIRTLAKRRHRENLRAQTVVVVPSGAAPPEHCAVFRRGHRARVNPALGSSLLDLDIRYEEVEVDIYRSRVRAHDRAVSWVPAAEAVAGAEVHPLERRYLREQFAAAEQLRQSPSRRAAEARARAKFDREGIDEAVPHSPIERLAPAWLAELIDDDTLLDQHIRSRRGDLSEVGWWNSPWQMTWDQASTAGVLRLSTEHLYCGVREEHGRWQYYRGLGWHLVIEGTADTRAEAEMMARAQLFAAWLARVKEIEAARDGDLSWGWPVPSPVTWCDIGDPQADY